MQFRFRIKKIIHIFPHFIRNWFLSNFALLLLLKKIEIRFQFLFIMLRNTHCTAIDEAVALLFSARVAVDDGFALAAMNQRSVIMHLQCPVDSTSAPLPC